jgi:hypothetical protein
MADKQPDETYSDEEAARRRDAVVRRMIATPPAPHKPPITPKRKTRPASKSRARVHNGKSHA